MAQAAGSACDLQSANMEAPKAFLAIGQLEGAPYTWTETDLHNFLDVDLKPLVLDQDGDFKEPAYKVRPDSRKRPGRDLAAGINKRPCSDQ
mmetsp:Transcript_72412/g.172949  ORF Transcript_72412/g.172949 Transcript_72412/m.172949 type:complete len:91 (+) Transcript_72412:12-284(+)